MSRMTLALCLIVGFSSAARSQDRIFTYTYQSGVLNPGQREIEPWVTFRWNKQNYFRAMDTRIEYEVGIARNLQTAFYLNSSSVATGDSSGITSGSEFSFSNEWKYKISDPVADPFGFAVYQEFTVAPKSVELESKLIIDKNFGRSLVAVNLVGACEFEKESEGKEIETETEVEIEADIAYGFRIAQGFYLGIESRNHNTITKGDWQHSALFVGPVFSYSTDHFWINVTVLPQVAAIKGATHGGLVLNEHEKLQTRMIFSYVF